MARIVGQFAVPICGWLANAEGALLCRCECALYHRGHGLNSQAKPAANQ
jgi:hypothetical protein